jgi:hypothetical protein
MTNFRRRLRSTLSGTLFAISFGAAVHSVSAEVPTVGSSTNSDFFPEISLAPFVVEGSDLSISIHARSNGDRRYAEKFGEEVVAVAYDSIDKSTGRGLIIVGDKGEPHPLYIFRKFIAMAGAGQLQPAVAARAPEVAKILTEWEDNINIDSDGEEVPITFEMVVKALPLPLKDIGSQLYQIAWLEDFDVERVELKFHSLTLADFESDQFDRYHWVFYLPPKSAFDQVLKEVLPLIMESEDVGFFGRTAIRGAMVVFKPMIRKAVEGARKGMLFFTVLSERTDYSKEDITALTGAYVEVLMPDFKFNGSTERQRAGAAIEAQKIKNIEYAKDPFITPERLTDFDPIAYTAFVGDYTAGEDEKKPETTHRFRIKDDNFIWQYRQKKPMIFYPAGENLFVIEDGKMTIEFLTDETGQITGVEERWNRRRKTVNRNS